MYPSRRSACLAVLVSLILLTVPLHYAAASVPAEAHTAHIQRTMRLVAARLPLTAHKQRLQAPAGVSVTVSAGYGGSGSYRTAAWVPVRVRISNPGPQFSGTL